MTTTVKKKEILCTLGPASMNDWIIKRLASLGVSLFRINLSHTIIDDLPEVIQKIQSQTSIPLCLDTEGAQIRTGYLQKGSVFLTENTLVQISRRAIGGDCCHFNLYPPESIDQCQIGDLISIDFNSVLMQVVRRDIEGLWVRVITSGVLWQNKAVSVDRKISLPPLTKKDYSALKIGQQMGVSHVALSFANHSRDVDEIRSTAGKNTFIISKIESRAGLKNLEEIAAKSDAILLDRGDLSREIPIEKIPPVQKEIIKRVKKAVPSLKIYVATNLLESMIKVLTPTRAEVNDIFNTLIDGADGLVLAAETAIGDYPVQSAMMVSKLIQEFESLKNGDMIDLYNEHALLLVPPHGGHIVNQVNDNPDFVKIRTFKKLEVSLHTLLDAEQIAIGTFSPLRGFMNKQELESVLESYRLPDGLLWPLPILVQISKQQAQKCDIGDKVALCLEEDAVVYAILHIEDKYSYDLNHIANKVFMTTDANHPGVKLLKEKGEYFLGGTIELIQRLPSEHKHLELTPRQARTIFENKGWSRVVGFHTRNVVHRGHEHIQSLALEQYHCDGIFIHPLLGPKKRGDYSSSIIFKSYQKMIENHCHKEEYFLGAFQSYPRYAGPREAVFTMLCRKNFGCSHFIIGRDHSGVGSYYEKNAARQLFEQLENIGIQPIFFNEMNYCMSCNGYTDNCQHGNKNILKISGTQGRKMLKTKKIPPSWFMREDISNLIIKEINKGEDVFVP